MQYTMNKSFSSGLFLSVLNRHGGKYIVIPVLWSVYAKQQVIRVSYPRRPGKAT